MNVRPSAGRVTARRLNRVEYNNTIRDLLGVAARPADEFPGRRFGVRLRQQRRRAVGLADVDGKVHAGGGKDLAPRGVRRNSAAETDAPHPADEPPVAGRLRRALGRERRACICRIRFVARCTATSRSRSMASTSSGCASRISAATTRTSPTKNEPVAQKNGESCSKRAGSSGRKRPLLGRPRQPPRRGGRGGGRAGGPGGGPRREPTPEELKARDEAARKAAPPRKLILTVDGAQVISTVIEGTGSFGYSQGEFTERAIVKAGERFIRASYPELANLDNPLQNINPDMRRGLFVDYLDIVGPFNPSKARPESYTKIFICSQKTPQCARTILSSLMERAYRRPVTQEEIASKLDLVQLAQREGDSFDEGIRLALQAILASPNFLFRVEANPTRARAELQAIAECRRAHAGAESDCRAASRRISRERRRARVTALVLPLGEHARCGADARREGRHAAAAGGPRGAGAPHDGRPEGIQPGRELGGAVASAAEPRADQARSQAVSHGRRRAPRCDAQRDDDVRRGHH